MGVGAIPTKSFEPIRTRARPHPSRLRLWPQLTSPRHYSYCRIEYNARVAWPRRRREGETVGAARMVGRAKRRSLSPAGECTPAKDSYSDSYLDRTGYLRIALSSDSTQIAHR